MAIARMLSNEMSEVIDDELDLGNSWMYWL